MEHIVRGNPIVFEATIKEYVPFGSLALSDPSTVKITLTDSNGTILANSASMTKSVTGKYYYIYQTTTSSALGIYTGSVVIDGGTYDGVYTTNYMVQVVQSND